MPQGRIRIFYQGEEFANIAGRTSQKLKSSKAMPMVPGATLLAALIPTSPFTPEPADPKDPYCGNWSLTARKAFLNKQKGESYQNKIINSSAVKEISNIHVL
jgi:hypothetical protein